MKKILWILVFALLAGTANLPAPQATLVERVREIYMAIRLVCMKGPAITPEERTMLTSSIQQLRESFTNDVAQVEELIASMNYSQAIRSELIPYGDVKAYIELRGELVQTAVEGSQRVAGDAVGAKFIHWLIPQARENRDEMSRMTHREANESSFYRGVLENHYTRDFHMARSLRGLREPYVFNEYKRWIRVSDMESVSPGAFDAITLNLLEGDRTAFEDFRKVILEKTKLAGHSIFLPDFTMDLFRYELRPAGQNNSSLRGFGSESINRAANAVQGFTLGDNTITARTIEQLYRRGTESFSKWATDNVGFSLRLRPSSDLGSKITNGDAEAFLGAIAQLREIDKEVALAEYQYFFDHVTLETPRALIRGIMINVELTQPTKISDDLQLRVLRRALDPKAEQLLSVKDANKILTYADGHGAKLYQAYLKRGRQDEPLDVLVEKSILGGENDDYPEHIQLTLELIIAHDNQDLIQANYLYLALSNIADRLDTKDPMYEARKAKIVECLGELIRLSTKPTSPAYSMIEQIVVHRIVDLSFGRTPLLTKVVNTAVEPLRRAYFRRLLKREDAHQILRHERANKEGDAQPGINILLDTFRQDGSLKIVGDRIEPLVGEEPLGGEHRASENDAAGRVERPRAVDPKHDVKEEPPK